MTKAAERKQATASRLSAVCRRRTADVGLGGFTIEEVCDEVGVSRRTFFNYFPSKEEAVLGVDEGEEMRVFIERFVTRGSRGWPAVVEDLIELVGEYVQSAGHNAEDRLELMRAVEREPRLLARFIGMGRDRELELLAMIATREGVLNDDLHARAAVDVMTTIMRSSADRLLRPKGSETFAAALADSFTALRAVLNHSA